MKQCLGPRIGLLAFVFLLVQSAIVKADGGAVRLRERVGSYQISVFTSPTTLCVGPVDISVLLQDAATGSWEADARVTVRMKSRKTGLVLEQSATSTAATNKLYRSAIFKIPDSGEWVVEIVVAGPKGSGIVHFNIDAAESPPPWQTFWPWFTWPVLVTTLFCIHQFLVCRKNG